MYYIFYVLYFDVKTTFVLEKETKNKKRPVQEKAQNYKLYNSHCNDLRN